MLTAAAAAALQLIEDSDGDTTAQEPGVARRIFLNLPDLCCGDGSGELVTANAALNCSCGMRFASWLTLGRIIRHASRTPSGQLPQPTLAAEVCFATAMQQVRF